MVSSILPRLLYIGDIPVVNCEASELLLYRLLQNYPAESLQIIENNTVSPDDPAGDRLPNVTYHRLAGGRRGRRHTRLAGIATAWRHLNARHRWQQVKPVVETFKPEVVLTVLHGSAWLAAGAVAEKYKLPLHVIVCDYWPRHQQVPKWLRAVVDRDFGAVYRQAVSRYCVSPDLARMCANNHRAQGSVLYPCQTDQAPPCSAPLRNGHAPRRGLTFAYAGSLQIPGTVTGLSQLAELLEPYDGHLTIYASPEPAATPQSGLSRKNVTIKPLPPAPMRVATWRDQADVLFLPATFDAQWQIQVATGFPDQLPEYTATGLPILIWGPPFCSAVRWAKANPGAAAVVKSPHPKALTAAVQRLVTHADYRCQLGQKALDIGQAYFGHTTVTQKFFYNLELRTIIPLQFILWWGVQQTAEFLNSGGGASMTGLW